MNAVRLRVFDGAGKIFLELHFSSCQNELKFFAPCPVEFTFGGVEMERTGKTEVFRRYEHDCEKCHLLGKFEVYDLYTCEQHGLGRTYIARYGSGGPDYTSMLGDVLESMRISEMKKSEMMRALLKAYQEFNK